MKQLSLAFLARFRKFPYRLLGLSTAVFLLLTACGGDDTSDDDLYAAVQPVTLTFDESDPAKNTIQVLANTAWQVYWTPDVAGVSVSPAAGSGNGSFCVTEMPEGQTLQFGVKTASGKSVPTYATVTRPAAEPDAATLSVAPQTLTFDAAGTNRITVTSNASWTVTASDPGLAFSPAAGSGNGTITVTAAPVGTSSLTVTAGEGSTVKIATVTISRAAESSGETLFSLDFGAYRSDWAWANQDESWKTQTGSGIATVQYSVYNVQIASPYGSDGKYAGASGGSYARMFDDPASDYFIIQNITLPAGQTDYTLSFGSTFPATYMDLAVSANGSTWKSLNYTGAATYDNWTQSVVGFTLAQAEGQISIRFVPTGIDTQYGLKFDDIVLTTGGGGQVVDFGASGKEYRWAELPGNWVAPTSDRATISGDYAFYTHWTRSVNSNKVVRNYSYCYDTRRHNPIWVAYPLHAVYGEGGFGRTSPDPWAPDPALDASYQSKIYRSDGPSGSDPYQYWSTNTIYNLGRSGSWTKGHLCMSRERGGKNQEINRQTFYPTNIAPQPNAKASTFGEVWGCIEALISGTNDRDNDITADDNSTNLNIVADTLFVVAGCYYQHDNWTDYDSSDYTQPTPDPNQKLCVMPTHQYKVLLRTRSGNTGKPIQDCSASELQCVGFWLDTFTSHDASSARTVLRQIAVSVSEIEQKTGLTFFPDVPASVKEQCNPSDWGF
ncbi:MAG TPA: DNA/RNA non-specific endonuclease [Candidatus Alistipes intestinigallinarum]|uniref:DNA/RNA non-specific endonuclease n=1 Tax=Candidatus Alistipes intestinigallinarum TaxID=2838440 RepID=A0A9D1YYF0_9BACT|nr:DNA/RNA non-specific endonuclease [Candidatus Alistipes intestinigallinarum]